MANKKNINTIVTVLSGLTVTAGSVLLVLSLMGEGIWTLQLALALIIISNILIFVRSIREKK